MAGTGLLLSILSIFVLFFYLFILILPVALMVALQVWLCRKNIKLGLILPGITLALSLLLALAVVSMGRLSGGNTLTLRNETTGEIIQEEHFEREWQFEPAVLLPASVIFLVTNIPTVVFGGIWLHYKGRKDTLEDLKKMRIEDLE